MEKPGMLSGQDAGPGQEGSPGSGLGGKAEEERRKGWRPERWRREEAWSRPGAVPAHLVPAGRGWDTAVPAAGPKLARARLQTPLAGCRSRRAPCQPHLGTRSLVGDPKSGERDPWDTPWVALPPVGCLSEDSEPPGVPSRAGWGFFYVLLDFCEDF